jgi:hypothetical protein
LQSQYVTSKQVSYRAAKRRKAFLLLHHLRRDKSTEKPKGRYTYNKQFPNRETNAKGESLVNALLSPFFGSRKKKALHKETLASQCKTHFFPFSLPSCPFCFVISFHSCRRYCTFLCISFGEGPPTRLSSQKGRLSRLAAGCGWLVPCCVACFRLHSPRGWKNLCGRGATATDGTTGAATTSPLAEAATATTTAVEVATAATATALLEATAAALEAWLLAVVGTDVAALLDPELLLADLEGAGGDGGLVALVGLEVDESAVLFVKSVKWSF